MRVVNLCACLTVAGKLLEPRVASAFVSPPSLGLRSRSYRVLRADNADAAANDGGTKRGKKLFVATKKENALFSCESWVEFYSS